MQTLNGDPLLQQTMPVARFNREQLPWLNSAIETGVARADDLVRAVRGLVDLDQLRAALTRAPWDRTAARRALQQIGFIASSLERHTQAAAVALSGQAGLAAAKGTGLDLWPGLEASLCELGEIAQHPPRDSYLTYWQINADQPLTFTGNSGEIYFNEVVNATNQIMGAACAMLRELQTGDLAPDSVLARDALEAAGDELERLIALYRGFMLRDPSGARRLEPDFFMRRMRSYIAPYPVGGVEQEGPNATYSPGWPLLDFALGIRSPSYRQTVLRRYTWMVPEHRALLDDATSVPSLAIRLLSWLDLEANVVRSLDQEILVARAGAKGGATLPVCIAYSRLVGAHRQLSGTHLSLINNQLIKPAQRLTSAECERIVPQPDGGVGGNPLNNTKKIDLGRREHPINDAFELGFRALRRGA